MASRKPLVIVAGQVQQLQAGDVLAMDHGDLTGLSDDDHAQYHNDARADAWLAAGHSFTFNHDNYDTAYGWGDHAGLYDAAGSAIYEADSAVSSHTTLYDHDNYDTAYGWGDHAGLYEASGAVGTHESTYDHDSYDSVVGYVIDDPGDSPVGVSGSYIFTWNTTTDVPEWVFRSDMPSAASATNGQYIRYNDTPAAALEWAGATITPTYMVFVDSSSEFAGTDKLTFDGTHFTLASGSALKSAGVLYLVPYGTKAIQARTTGNARGNYAVDLQVTSSSNTEVASGDYSFCVGGRNTASGGGAACIGYNCLASNTYTCAFNYSQATGFAATSFGYGTLASAHWTLASGAYGLANMYAQTARGANRKSANGDRQTSDLCAWVNTANATQTEVFLGGQTAGGNASALIVPENTIWGFTINMVARQTNDDFSTASWTIRGTIARNTGGNVAIKNQATLDTYQDDATWDFTVAAYVAGQRLQLLVTGAADNNISWLASIRIEQVTG